jgi:hypothetical protein
MQNVFPAAWALLTALLVAFPGAGSCAATTLDQKKIHSQYNEGDFEVVIKAIEGFRKANKTYSREDSLFIAKHLAVVYSANPESREKGRYYMYQLLELLPSAKLIDMYVSDEIDRIFDRVREEYLTRQHSFGVDTAQVRASQTAPATARPREEPTGAQPAKPAVRRKGNPAYYWAAGGAAVVAVGVAAYFIFSAEPAPDKVYVVK